MSVEPSPPDTTSAPWEAAPSPKASASGPEEVRMSCTVTTAGAPVSRAKAAPTASATLSSSSSGTVPRMSYALKIFAYSATKGCLPRLLLRCQAPGCPGHDAPGRDRWTPSLPGMPRRRSHAGLARPAVLRRRAQHPEMAAPAHLDPLPDRLAGRARFRRLHHRVGQGLQIVLLLLGRAVREAEHFPADGHGHPV